MDPSGVDYEYELQQSRRREMEYQEKLRKALAVTPDSEVEPEENCERCGKELPCIDCARAVRAETSMVGVEPESAEDCCFDADLSEEAEHRRELIRQFRLFYHPSVPIPKRLVLYDTLREWYEVEGHKKWMWRRKDNGRFRKAKPDPN